MAGLNHKPFFPEAPNPSTSHTTPTTPQTPFFTHDCTHCGYLGSATVNEKKLDFYFHTTKGRPASETSLIYRYGNEGGDYGSTTVDCVSPLSWEAMLALGLYVKHLGATSANNCFVRGGFYKHGWPVLELR